MAGTITESTTISSAETYVLTMASRIFVARDLSSVEEEIYRASKICMGLQALNQDLIYTDATAREQIIEGLNTICKIYNQQTIPLITL